MSTLETVRLTLRPRVAADAEAYAAMRYQAEVAKWLPPAEGDPVAAARGTIGRFASSWQQRRCAPWGVFLQGKLIGHAGLNFVPEFDETEVPWAPHPDAGARATPRKSRALHSLMALTRWRWT